MSKNEKLIKRLLSFPKDFTFAEMVKILSFYGYTEESTGKTSGSRVKFVNLDYPGLPIRLHKPHPSNILKEYQLKDIISVLTDLELINQDNSNEKEND